MVPMRDGVRLCADVFRPDTDEPLPALLAFAIYNKDLQAPDVAGTGRAAPVPVPGRPFQRLPPEQGPAGRTAPGTGRTMAEALANPDYKLHPHLYNVVTMKGQHMPALFDVLIDPYEAPGVADASEAAIRNIDVPVCTGSGWYGYTYKTHLQRAQTYWRHLPPEVPKKQVPVAAVAPRDPRRGRLMRRR